MNEFNFIEAIKQSTYQQSGLIKGIGDDAAVFRESTEDIVTAVDTFVEGIHFTKTTLNPYHIGYKVLAVNVSDMAAMGATPRYYLVSIICPETYSSNDYEMIFRGMREVASRYNMDLIGGDTVSGNELSISITVIGTVPSGKARYRDQAKHGDIVFVTGTLGDSQAGLHILENQLEVKGQTHLIKKHQRPEPLVQFAKNMRHIKRLVLNDISDGIASEINEIAQSSDVTIELMKSDLPISLYLDQFPQHLKREWMLYGGEDFELVGTVSEDDWEVVEKAATQSNTNVAQIGYVRNHDKSKHHVYLMEDNQYIPLDKGGYIHLK